MEKNTLEMVTVQLDFMLETMRYTAAMLAEAGIDDKAAEVARAAETIPGWIQGLREDYAG